MTRLMSNKGSGNLNLELVLIDKDELYLDILSEYIMKNTNLFNVVCFTAIKYFKEYMCKKTADIVLLGETEETIEDMPSETLVLDWGKEIEKYQRVDDLIEKIMFKYAQKTGDMRGIGIGENNAEMIAVYSPKGGSGKTTLALALAVLAQSKGINTVYFNLEKFSSVPNFFEVFEDKSLSEIFLSLKEKNPKLILNILKNKLVDFNSGITYFSPPETQSEIEELEKEEIRYLFDEMKKIEDFKLIVVDLETNFNNIVVEILNQSDKILIPIFDDELSKLKINQFYNELDICFSERDIKEKILTIINKSENFDSLHNSKEIRVPFVKEAETRDLKKLGEKVGIYLDEVLYGK